MWRLGRAMCPAAAGSTGRSGVVPSHVLGTGTPGAAFRAYRAGALRSVDFADLRSEGYGLLIELAHSLERSGVKFVEVPVQLINRVEGRSKMSAKMVIESFRVVTAMAISERWRRPPGQASAERS